MTAKGIIPENVSGFTKFNVEYYWCNVAMNPSSSGYGGAPSFVVESGRKKSVSLEQFSSSGSAEVVSVTLRASNSPYYLRCRSGGNFSYPGSGCVGILRVWLSE